MDTFFNYPEPRKKLSGFFSGHLLLTMPIGAKIVKSMSVNAFDKLILILLASITFKIFFDIFVK